MDWAALLAQADELARHSEDPSRKNGALIVKDGTIVSSGINRLPDGVVSSPARWVRPAKYHFVEHAERDALYDAARRGITLGGATMVCPWAACADCARAIIALGISVLVRSRTRLMVNDPLWTPQIRAGDAMLHEAGVEVMDL